MMGPNLYCRQQICNHGYGVYNSLGRHHKPRNAEDVKLIEKKTERSQGGNLAVHRQHEDGSSKRNDSKCRGV